MFIKIRTDLGTERVINTDNIAFIDSASKLTCLMELKSHAGFDIKIGLGIDDFLKVVKGEALFSDLYIDQGYQKTIENSSKELDNLKFNEETPESKERLEEFKEELKPKPIPTFSKKKLNDEAKLLVKEVINKETVDTQSDVW